MRPQPRRRIAEGIYGDRSGLAATVKVGTVQREKRWPLGTDLHTIRVWRDDTRAELRRTTPLIQRGTLAADAARYLARMQHLVSHKARRFELEAWKARLGDRLRGHITRDHVLDARVAWLEAGTSPKTINNRVQTLRHLYRTLDGPEAKTPCDGLRKLDTLKTPPVFVPDRLVRHVEAVLAGYEQIGRLPDSKTRARFCVLATTGKRPSEVMRTQRSDVDLERRVWVVRDGKGGRSPGLYLNDDMRAAWELFIAADAWGVYNTNSFARVLRGAGWPAGVRPYNLRHTTWIAAMERGADARDVQAGAGHKRFETTQQHYVGVRGSRMQKLSELLDGRFNWATTLTGAVPPG